MVTTPSGKPVAMVHCNNCTNDMNAWVSLLGETAKLFGAEVSTGELFTKLYQKSLEGDADCSGVLTYNYMAGEGITHLDEGRPMVVRKPESELYACKFPAFPALRNHVNAQAWYGYSRRRACCHRLPDRPRRPVQDAGCRPEVYGCCLPRICDLYGDRRARAGLTAWRCLRPIWCRNRTARRLNSIWRLRFSRTSSARRLRPIPKMKPASTAILAGTAAHSQRKMPQ